VSIIDESLGLLHKARVLCVSSGDPTPRNAAIAYTAIENAVLAAKSGEVDWTYVEHELTTARLRYPLVDHSNIRVAVRELLQAGPEESNP
jgi:ribosomal protein S26